MFYIPFGVCFSCKSYLQVFFVKNTKSNILPFFFLNDIWSFHVINMALGAGALRKILSVTKVPSSSALFLWKACSLPSIIHKWELAVKCNFLICSASHSPETCFPNGSTAADFLGIYKCAPEWRGVLYTAAPRATLITAPATSHVFSVLHFKMVAGEL